MSEKHPLRIGQTIREHPELFGVGLLTSILLFLSWQYFPQSAPISTQDAFFVGTLLGMTVAGVLTRIVFWYLENVRQWEIEITKPGDFYE